MQLSIAKSTTVHSGKRNVSSVAARPASAKPSVQHGAVCGCNACNLPVFSGSNRRVVRASAAADQAKLLTRRAMGSVTKGAPLEKYEYTVPAVPGAQEIDVRITHNGLCHSDLHMALDDWGISKFPFVPGHEAVGEVVAVGASVKNIKVGDVVGAGWIRDSCRRCLACLSGDENVCEAGYTGSIVLGNNGGFQDVMRFPADFLFKVPSTLKREHAAPLLCAGVTVFAPLKRHVNRFGMKVAIMGVGGLGHLALQFAHAMGCDVTAIDVFPDKEAEAKKLGANHFVTWESITGGKTPAGDKLDLILNCASGKIDTGKLLSLLKPDGKLVQIGIPGGGAVMNVPLQDLVFGQKTTAGSIVGGRKDMMDMLEFAGLHGVKPMIETFPLSKVNEAVEKMKKGLIRYRVVLTEDFKDW